MDNVVAVKVLDAERGWVGFLTRGRLWDQIEDHDVLRVVKAHLRECGIEHPSEVHLCDSLRDVGSATYFFEGLINFAREPIPFGPEYEDWKNLKKAALESGKDIYYVGPLAVEERE